MPFFRYRNDSYRAKEISVSFGGSILYRFLFDKNYRIRKLRLKPINITWMNMSLKTLVYYANVIGIIVN